MDTENKSSSNEGPYAHIFWLHRQRRLVHDADLTGADLSGVNLDRFRGDSVRLEGTDLSAISLQNARFTACNLRNATMIEANLTNATLRLCVLDGVRASRSLWVGARIEDNSLAGADFSNSNLRGARLSESSWVRALLQKAVLEDVSGDGVVFRGTDLRGARLAHAHLPEADFRGADLTGVDFSGAELPGADFRGAILRHINWEGAIFPGASFSTDDPDAEEALRTLGKIKEAVFRDADTTISGSAQTAAWAAMVAAAKANQQPPDLDNLNLKSELEELFGNWPEFQSQAGGLDLQEFARFITETTKPTNQGGAPSIVPLLHLLDELDSIEDDAPPKEWQAWLSKLFPAIDNSEGGEFDLEEVADIMENIQRQSRKP